MEVHSFFFGEDVLYAKPSVGLPRDPVCGCAVVLKGSDALQNAVGPLHLDRPLITIT